MLLVKNVLAAVFMVGVFVQATQAMDFDPPEIVVLGDSQIPFGSGQAFVDFFSDIEGNCAPNLAQSMALEPLRDARVGVIGVRSTSIHSWIARGGAAKNSICKVDPKWRVNAGTFGSINTTENKYVQIGRGEPYQFCTPGQSAFEAMFAEGYYAPKLLFMSFLGNATGRWADSPEKAVADVEEMMAQLPEDVPCIFMTTAPAYSQKIVNRRLRAQMNLMDAFKSTGARCTFIPGATEATVAANQGNSAHFRRHSNGRVKDPYHPNKRAAARFFELQRDNLCNAIFEQIPPMKVASAPTDGVDVAGVE